MNATIEVKGARNKLAIPFARVMPLYPDGQHYGSGTETDLVRGRAEFAVPDRTYLVMISAPGYGAQVFPLTGYTDWIPSPDKKPYQIFLQEGYKDGDWTNVRYSDPINNPFWAWGYVRDAAGNVVNDPHIKVFTPDGKQYGKEYIGWDTTGAWGMSIPSGDHILEITAPGYKKYVNKASAVGNGYKLFMEKGETPPVQPVVTDADKPDEKIIAANAQGDDNTGLLLVAGAGVLYFIGKQYRWWR